VNTSPDVRSVLFHSPDDVPYGPFSTFSHTPIWIAGERYLTVEHWYQAMRAVGDEHEWIRAAATPEEAKRRARSIEPRRYWSEEKILIMYRGVLAKFRQHPRLTELLLSTGDAGIHESCDDLFWGDKGHDWLGRIVSHVRAQLRDPSSDGPLADLLRARFLNYEASLSIRNIRNGGESWFVHLIRYRESQRPIELLRRIVEEGILKASRQLNGHYAVCFSAAPISYLEQRVFGDEARMRIAGAAHVYSPFGLAVTYDFGRELGIRPVLPVPTEVASDLPSYLRFLVQPYSARDLVDYTHEDEWRTKHDVDIREGPFALVLPVKQGLRLQSIYGLSRIEVLQALECLDGTSGDELG
jgi:ribA/ribD-fused uncharacterized protein